MAARRISLVNFKGGVGKTSLAVNLSACLAHDLGKKVLVVDCDPQSNSSIWLMGAKAWTEISEKPHRSVYGIFLPDAPSVAENIHRDPLHDATGNSLIHGLHVLPATYDLMDLEHDQLAPRPPYYRRFYNALIPHFDEYDYILFDCPPNVYKSTRCALFTSEEIYVPCNLDLLSYIGLKLLSKKVTQFHADTLQDRGLIPGHLAALIRGIVINDLDSQATGEESSKILSHINQTLDEIRNRAVIAKGAEILPTKIRHYVAASRAAFRSRPVTLETAGAARNLKEDYLNLARYLDSTPLA